MKKEFTFKAKVWAEVEYTILAEDEDDARSKFFATDVLTVMNDGTIRDCDLDFDTVEEEEDDI